MNILLEKHSSKSSLSKAKRGRAKNSMKLFSSILTFFGKDKKIGAGEKGEKAAAKFLTKNANFKILRKNFRKGRLEIDLIAMDGEVLVFVEVKARVENSLVSGYYAAASQKKRRNIKNCALQYMKALKNPPKTWRYDIVEVQHSREGEILDVKHFPNVGF